MNHLLDMVFAARILAELDGMGQEFPNSKQQSALPRVHLEDYRNYGCHFDDLKDLIDKIEDLYFPVRAR